MKNKEVSEWYEKICENMNPDGGLSLPLRQEPDVSSKENQVMSEGRRGYIPEVQNCLPSGETAGITNMIEHLSTTIERHNELLLANVEGLIRKNELTNRNKKKKRIAEKIVVSPNDYFRIVFEYDNGEEIAFILSENISGEYEIFNMDFEGREEEEKFCIYFPRENIAVIGSKKKASGSEYLYLCFIKAGVKFTSQMPESLVKRQLKIFFLPLLEKTQNIWKVSPFAGWSGKKFFDANNFLWQKTTEFPDLPVFHKCFARAKLTANIVRIYFRYLRQIKNPRDRALIMSLPYMGIISSILTEERCGVPFYINFVVLDDTYIIKICKGVKVFERGDLLPYSLNISSKDLKELLQNVNDEIVLLDGMYDGSARQYLKEKLFENAVEAGNELSGRKGRRKLKQRNGSAMAAIFSSRQILQKNCINVFMDEDFWEDRGADEEFDSMQVIEAVMTSFVSHVERTYDGIVQCIHKKREKLEDKKRCWEIVQDIVTNFWEANGYDLRDMLGLSQNFRFSDIINDMQSEDLVKQFKMIMRRQMDEMFADNVKEARILQPGTIYFDDKKLFVPVVVFKEILKKAGLTPYKAQLLLGLEQAQVLRRDSEGYSRKKTIGSKRYEVYEIERDFFNQIGMAEVISLAKERKEEC